MDEQRGDKTSSHPSALINLPNSVHLRSGYLRLLRFYSLRLRLVIFPLVFPIGACLLYVLMLSWEG